MPLTRRDKRGRIIGYNWWRDYNTTMLRDSTLAWESRRESGQSIGTDSVPGATPETAYYQLSDSEYRSLHPRPTLKEFLLANAGIHEREE